VDERGGHTVHVPLAVLAHGVGLELPCYATDGAAGLDVRAAVEGELIIAPGAAALVPTGLVAAVPRGFELQVRARSGLAARHRVGVLNSPGTIDSDYRGEIQIIIMNFGPEPFLIKRGDRIAQLVLARVEHVQWERTNLESLSGTPRGSGGFGHTG
jgi:dUTP pyrophosphatase